MSPKAASKRAVCAVWRRALPLRALVPPAALTATVLSARAAAAVKWRAAPGKSFAAIACCPCATRSSTARARRNISDVACCRSTTTRPTSNAPNKSSGTGSGPVAVLVALAAMAGLARRMPQPCSSARSRSARGWNIFCKYEHRSSSPARTPRKVRTISQRPSALGWHATLQVAGVEAPQAAPWQV